jgi:YVTN family beta-propeller protein
MGAHSNALLAVLVQGLASMCFLGHCLAGPLPGEVVKVFDYGVTEFVLHPTRPVLYANDYRNQSIVAIDTERLSVIDTMHVGTYPSGLVLSPDGARLYAGDYSGLSIIDTITHEVTAIPLDFKPGTIAYGYDDRLWITSHQTSYIIQLDAMTGAPSGELVDGGNFGMLQTTADHKTLLFAERGPNSVVLREFDISDPMAELVWQNERRALGSHARDLVLSHDGAMLAVVASGGNQLPNRYDIGLFDAVDKHVLGVLEPGYYPQQLAFSPDDSLAYVVHTDREIDVFSTMTFEHLDSWRFAGPYDGDTIDIITDRTGQYLFAAKPDHISVLATGQEVVPEPPSFELLVLAIMLTILFSRQSGELTPSLYRARSAMVGGSCVEQRKTH